MLLLSFDLINHLAGRLNHLSRFQYFINELLIQNARIRQIDHNHQISPYFQSIQYLKETKSFRTLSTRLKLFIFFNCLIEFDVLL